MLCSEEEVLFGEFGGGEEEAGVEEVDGEGDIRKRVERLPGGFGGFVAVRVTEEGYEAAVGHGEKVVDRRKEA